MVIASCPLRISLVGGSTDHPEFLKKYGEGRVISFPSNLRVYVTIHRDIAGINSLEKKFIINYKSREETDFIDDIKNDIVRETLRTFNIEEPLTISFTSDITSSGSGLASSSAYTMALVAALDKFHLKFNYTEANICEIAHRIEKKINPLVGKQDFYGSMSGGTKKISFKYKGETTISYKFTPYIDNNMALIPTNIKRESTKILSTLDIDKCLSLLLDVDDLDKAIKDMDIDNFYNIIKRSWENKKITSPLICEDEKIKELDNNLKNNKDVVAHKLLGAGNGGYFLTFGNLNNLKLQGFPVIPIHMSNEGVKVVNI